MRAGQIVKCVKIDGGVGYLTVGAEYVVTAGKGDASPEDPLWVIPTDSGFTISDDYGGVLYCLYPNCSHGDWELIDGK